MSAIYPISDPQKRLAEVKERARCEVVHLTENGRGAYGMMSEDYFEGNTVRKQDEAAWVSGLIAAVEAGMCDVEQGCIYMLEEAPRHIEELRARLDGAEVT